MDTPDSTSTLPSPDVDAGEAIPADVAIEVRKLVHELSNSLEIIVQTSYLLASVEMKEPGSDWLRMLDDGVRKAMRTSLELREYVKSHSQQ